MLTVHGVTDAPVTIPANAMIVGPSQAGKTRILNALMGAIADTGLDGGAYPSHLIPTGGEVRGTGEDGTVLYRRIPSKRVTGPDRDVRVVTIASPVVLASLLCETKDSAARDVADRLDAIIPGDSAANLIAAFVQPGEPTTEKGALDLRRDAKTAADHARGVLDEASRALGIAETDARAIEAPDDAKTTAARAYLAALSTSLEARQRHRARVQMYEAAKTHLAAWDARQVPQEPTRPRPVGEAPSVPPRPVLVLPPEPSDEANREAAALVRRLEDGTPRRPVMPEVPEEPACAALKGCTLADGRKAIADANDRAWREYQGQLATHQERLTAAKEAHTLTSEALVAARAAHVEACDALRADHRAAIDVWAKVEGAAAVHALDSRAWSTYDAAVAARGERPEVPADPGPAPTVDDEHADRARARVRDAETYKARRADADKRVTAARQRVDDATAKVSAAAAALIRADELLTFCRSAADGNDGSPHTSSHRIISAALYAVTPHRCASVGRPGRCAPSTRQRAAHQRRSARIAPSGHGLPDAVRAAAVCAHQSASIGSHPVARVTAAPQARRPTAPASCACSTSRRTCRG